MAKPILADSKCFIAQENSKILLQEGCCTNRHSPCSTFKVAISLMRYNEGILVDSKHPEWPFKSDYSAWVKIWQLPHNPTTWIKDSCVWYSQIITQQLGSIKLQNYLAKFQYGNQDISGDLGKNNGLTNSWLTSSLLISPMEQLVFINKLVTSKLPTSLQAQKNTRRILFIAIFPEHWDLYGKTGTGNLILQSNTLTKPYELGWFIGWIEKNNRRITCVSYIELANHSAIPAGKQAMQIAKEKLLSLIKRNKKMRI